MSSTSAFDAEWVASSCESVAAEAWEGLRGGSQEAVDFLVHVCYLKRYLRPDMTVLTVGMGADRFRHTLRGLGCRPVRTVSLGVGSPGVDFMKGGSAPPPAPKPDAAPDSGEFQGVLSESVDGVVAFGGPRCQLLDRAWGFLAECARVCRPGGPILASFLSPWGALRQYLDGAPSWLPAGAEGSSPPESGGDETWHEVANRYDLIRASDLRAMAEEVGLDIRALSASNALSVGWAGFLADLAADPEQCMDLLRLELETCQETEALDMGTHIILVGQNPWARQAAGYSTFKLSTGLTRAAPNAGITLARKATPRSPRETAMYVAGSVGTTP
jgi:hypothetical protein